MCNAGSTTTHCPWDRTLPQHCLLCHLPSASLLYSTSADSRGRQTQRLCHIADTIRACGVACACGAASQVQLPPPPRQGLPVGPLQSLWLQDLRCGSQPRLVRRNLHDTRCLISAMSRVSVAVTARATDHWTSLASLYVRPQFSYGRCTCRR